MISSFFKNRSISKAAKAISNSKRVLVFTGAGISASSGIPTFRDVGGLWTNEDIAFFGSPEAWIQQPAQAWELYEKFRSLTLKAQPTVSHIAVKQLESLCDTVVVTTNVDSLHHRVGTKAYEMHGTLRQVRCFGCDNVQSLPVNSVSRQLKCDKCGSSLRHDVVLWDEAIKCTDEVGEAFENADCIIFIGMSGSVTSTADFASEAKKAGKFVIEINPANDTPASKYTDVHLCMSADEALPNLVKKVKGYKN